MKLPIVYGHRGASALEPENTLRAFEKAFEDGAEGIEFDVRKSADQQLVVIHDSTVNRTANGTGKVNEKKIAELNKLDVGKGEEIPLLKDVLEKYGNKYWLNIELKEIGMEELLVKMLSELKIAKKVIISSFLGDAIRKVKELDDTLQTAYLYAIGKLNIRKLKKKYNFDGIHPRKNLVNKRLMKKTRELELFVNTWTVDNPIKAKELVKLEVDGIITNNPQVIITAFKS